MNIKDLNTDTISEELVHLQNKLFDLSARNPFIQVKPEKLFQQERASGETLKKLYQKAQFYRKEYDLDTTLQIQLFLKWKEPHKTGFYTSPLLFKPAKIQLTRKIENEFEIITDDSIPFQINPVLDHSFSRFYDLDLPVQVEDETELINVICNALNSKNYHVDTTDCFNENESWQIIRLKCLGNFNYKKSLLGKDYERILRTPNEGIIKLITGNKKKPQQNINEITNILDLDFSQKEAVKLSGTDDLVIQGPPGTGKSHTIVGMIGNFLAQKKKVLFVSQKKSALEVVYERLHSIGLGNLTAYFSTDQDEKKAFYQHLRSSWEDLSSSVKNIPFNQPVPTRLTDYYLGQFQAHNEKLGASVQEVVAKLERSGFYPESLNYNGRLPILSDWEKNEPFLTELEKTFKENHATSNLSEAAFTLLNKAVFSEPDPVVVLQKRINELEGILVMIEDVASTFGIAKNLREIFDYALASSILNMVNHAQLNLLDKDSKAYVRFGNLAKKFELLRLKVERAELANKPWKTKPSKSEITELIDLLKHHHAPKGILGIMRRRDDKLQKAFKGFSPNLSNIAKQQLLEELRNEWNLKSALEEVKIKLRHDFNITDPNNEITHIIQLRNKLQDISGSAYITILEHENANDLIKVLSDLHPRIQHFNNIARFIFHEPPAQDIDQIRQIISKVRSSMHLFKLILPQLQRYFLMPFEIRDLVSKCSLPVNHISAIISYNNLIDQTRFESDFDKLTGHSLQEELEDQLRIRPLVHAANVKKIVASVRSELDGIETLLSMPSSKLNNEEKQRKNSFRTIKKLFVHELSKKQQHIPVKSFSKETWDYLSVIHPVWIMNPLSVSERLCCESQIFDVVIFDESSQIPFEDALPSVYRAKQVIVVGDEKQMPPSSFFSSNSQADTLLDKASLRFSNIMLKWHYRSMHPDLIRFSNQYFYDNELLTVPPVETESPIEFIKVDGIYESGVNPVEAAHIAQYLIETKPAADQLGIIAFSKDQEELIRNTLIKNQVWHEDILIRSLENVQGIERNHIIISIGYAPDKDGTFNLRFGPVNQENGANRLNVLFTRAKAKITIFTSITGDDFKLTDNPGVNCLKNYLIYAENTQNFSISSENSILSPDKEIVYYAHKDGASIQCSIQHESGKVLLIDPCSIAEQSNDLFTAYAVLKGRFEKVKILLTKDKWLNPELFEKQIEQYFKL